MAMEFKLPDPGEGIHEVEIIKVLVSPGDYVEDGQSILEIETDKATSEVPAPVTGKVKEVRVESGDTVQVGDVVMVFEETGEKKREEPAKKEKAKKEEEAEERPEKREEKPQKAGKPPDVQRGEAGKGRKGKGPVPAAPSTRRVARELGVDLKDVTPSGPGGRVLTEDVRAHAEGKEPARKPEEEPKEEKAPTEAAEKKFEPEGRTERMAWRSVRRTTAKRMIQSWNEIPHVTHQDAADITDLETLRQKHKEEIKAQGGSLTLTMFVLKAVAAALRKYPRFNAELDMDAEEIILKYDYHIGVAVDTDRGLLVPVVRDVDCKSIVDLAMELPQLAERVRNGDAEREDLTGGTFTVTNVGPMGGTGFAPIINHPQVAILGLARAKLQPVVVGDLNEYEIRPRLILPLALGFDHRVVDGADAARFVRAVVEAIEDPETLMMKV
jgi:pyruvate dehydrogenase E2 component (dihydrolipoamide acetyltransferase)